jgi:hypothetical protein
MPVDDTIFLWFCKKKKSEAASGAPIKLQVFKLVFLSIDSGLSGYPFIPKPFPASHAGYIVIL